MEQCASQSQVGWQNGVKNRIWEWDKRNLAVQPSNMDIMAFSLKNTFNFSKLKVGSLLVFFEKKKMNGDPAIIHNLPSMKCKI